MFSQVTKTSAIIKHTIHYDTIFDFGTETLFWALFLEADLDFHPDAFSSYNEPSNGAMEANIILLPRGEVNNRILDLIVMLLA
jgi:hypothetical protein